MSLRIRFALVFSLLIFIVLMISAGSIYLLNESFRKEEFFKRLKNEADEAYGIYTSLFPNTAAIEANIHQEAFSTLTELKVTLLDRSYKPLLTLPIQHKQEISAEHFEEARQKGETSFIDGQRQTVVLYRNENNQPVYIITSAQDFFGRRKNDNLKMVLAFTVIGGFMLAGVLALIFVNRLVKPLENFQQQIQEMSVQDLTKRVTVPPRNIEVARIGKSFNNMLSSLEKAFEMRKSFVQHASHELRTPLATMIAQTEAALDQNLTPQEYRRVLASLKEDQQQLIDLTNSLLLLSQYEKQDALHLESPVRIDEIIYDTIDDIKKLYEEAIITVAFENVPDNESWLAINGNEPLIKSAIFNLIKNAILYSTEPKMTISINASAAGVTLQFTNVGKQLLQDEQEKVFLPFFRGANAASKKGSGLGLSIVHRIITLHNGTINYSANPGGINSFIVFFPAQ